MFKRLTEKEYWDEIKSIVDSVISESKEYDQDREDTLWETIDGHQWVIYTFYNYQVLSISPNAGYAVEEWGTDGIVTDGYLDTARLTFGAMLADCHEEMANRPDEEEDEEEEE